MGTGLNQSTALFVGFLAFGPLFFQLSVLVDSGMARLVGMATMAIVFYHLFVDPIVYLHFARKPDCISFLRKAFKKNRRLSSRKQTGG